MAQHGARLAFGDPDAGARTECVRSEQEGLVDAMMVKELYEFLPRDVVDGMVERLHITLAEIVRETSAAVDAGDALALALAVHRVNGTAGNLGATALTTLAKSIDHTARTGCAADALARAAEFPALVQQTLAALDVVRDVSGH